MKRIVWATVAILAICSPAIAEEYYIVREGDDKECKIVETRPTEETVVVIGDRAYVTREEAEKELAVVCEDD
ncbi:hypothetical protein [Hyphomicrobium sp. CS1GBMeth3]|uniref:hypothetical protein n=1 Tax=Hyphomicrobium sp. CS1GBMeth3 TaxID=1892845 RepID=UPI0009309415|nr:hypothetical protein [Hyphomicrobium sp. CS1GBMeth3]